MWCKHEMGYYSVSDTCDNIDEPWKYYAKWNSIVK